MKLKTGIPGLDPLLKGGLERGWSYLIKGEPGTGKTIFGLQFLLEGKKSVYISFDEVIDEIKLQANQFGWNIDGIYFIDKVKEMDILKGDPMFYDSISEITEFIESITSLEELEGVERVFIDGVGVIRDVTKNDAIYRRLLSSIINFLNSIRATTIISAEMITEVGRDIISYLTSGEFVLRKVKRKDGKILRTIEIVKYRGGDAYLGEHYFSITKNGIKVFPIIPVHKRRDYDYSLISTGNKELDKMLGGGILKGSKVYIAGKTGVGKTNMCLEILKRNDLDGKVGIIYTFDESERIILRKMKDIFNYQPKSLIVREVNATSLGEFYNMVIEDLNLNPEIIAIDPLNALDDMAITTNEFVSTLSLLKGQLEALGVTLLCVYEITQPLSEFHFTGAGMSRFADYLIVGRHMEMNGELLKVISVIKNRFGDHERFLRILNIEKEKGLIIGRPLIDYSGIMKGVIERRSV